MSRILFLLITIFFVREALAQTDSLQSETQDSLVRGIYETYDEFAHNRPSIKKDFTVNYFFKSKDDSTIVGASFETIDGSKSWDNAWGFCDGKSAFVKYSNRGGSKKKHMGWKLGCTGPYSFFMYAHKDINAVGPGIFKLITGALTAVGPTNFDLIVLDAMGKFKYPDIGLIKKYLKPYPELLRSFSAEADQYEQYDYANADPPETDEILEVKQEIIKKYLVKLNKVIWKNP